MYHKYTIICPDCEKEISYKGVFFSAEGRVMLDGVCKPCAKFVRFESTFAEVRFELMLVDDKAGKGNGGETN